MERSRPFCLLAPFVVAAGLLLARTSLEGQGGEGFQSADLPDVRQFLDGRVVRDAEQWPERRAELKALWQDTHIGRYPEKTPKLKGAELRTIWPKRFGTQATIRLTFEIPEKDPVSFDIAVWQRTHDGTPQPLLLTQPRHYQIAWAEAAARRGYTVCLYPGVDYNHREIDFPGYEKVWRQFRDAYPEASWQSSLGIQAWIASRVIDFFLGAQALKFDVPIKYPIVEGQIGIIGHSRYGKQSLYAAAFDERITAVLARSSGSPTAAGYRFTGRHTFMETVRDYPGEWALPQLKTYLGRENQLPIEGNGLLALIAPRACQLHTAYHDGGDPTFAVEKTYQSAKRAYQLLGAEEKLTLRYREGNHDPITPEHIEDNLDWFDTVFGRPVVPKRRYAEKLLHAFDAKAWLARQAPQDLVPPDVSAPLRERVQWMFGVKSEGAAAPRPPGGEAPSRVADWSRDRWKPEGVRRQPIELGEGVSGNLMMPATNSGKEERATGRPVVIWLHPFNYSHGYNEGYGVEGTTIYYRLAQAGYAVICYDQLGFGDRLLDGPRFDESQPRWSRFGRMVEDVGRGVDFTEASAERFDLDPKRIYLLGYSLGGMVALHAAAMDERIAGVAAFSGFTPFRQDTDASGTGGIRRWWDWHGLLPKLALFDGKEEAIPYDYDELLSAMAPRPVLAVAPQQDWHASVEAVRASIEVARRTHPSITFEAPDDINRFQSEQQERAIAWLDSLR